jgi:hypothetical protein
MARKNNRPSSYSDYTLEDLREILGLDNTKKNLNLLINKIQPSDFLTTTMKRNQIVPINTEKARSELLITPILVEWINNNPLKMQYLSGNTFDVEPSKALKGRCDFLFTKHFSLDIVAPVVAIFEAKDDNVDNWYAQCGAEMYAARLFNQRKNEPYHIIHGAVTDGYEWVFLRLEDDLLCIDQDRYYLRNLSELLGVLQTIMNFYDSK